MSSHPQDVAREDQDREDPAAAEAASTMMERQQQQPQGPEPRGDDGIVIRRGDPPNADDAQDDDEDGNDNDDVDSDTDSSFVDTSSAGIARKRKADAVGGGGAGGATGQRSRRNSMKKNSSIMDSSLAGSSVAGSSTSANTGKRKGRKKKVEELDPEQEFETQWICTECKEAECHIVPDASVLLICEGPCRRLFHYPCVGLKEVPPVDVPYRCPDCTAGKHRCSFCQDYGVDGVDVWLCDRRTCGLFFHEACLAMRNVDVQVVGGGGAVLEGTTSTTNDSDGGTSTPTTTTTSGGGGRLSFVCPAHCCWTCTQTDLKERERLNIRDAARGGGNGKKKKSQQPKRRRAGAAGGSFEGKSEKFLYVSIEGNPAIAQSVL